MPHDTFIATKIRRNKVYIKENTCFKHKEGKRVSNTMLQIEIYYFNFIIKNFYYIICLPLYCKIKRRLSNQVLTDR